MHPNDSSRMLVLLEAIYEELVKSNNPVVKKPVSPTGSKKKKQTASELSDQVFGSGDTPRTPV